MHRIACALLLALPLLAPSAPAPGVVLPLAAQLAPADARVGALFGYDVAIDGDTMVVGSTGIDAAYVFVRSATGWTEQAKLTPVGGGGYFGAYVAIDGDTVVVGAPLHSHSGAAYAGAAYVFVRSGTAWAQQAKLVSGDPGFADVMGTGLGIEGDTLFVGSYGDDNAAGADAGAVWQFERSGAAWSRVAKLVPRGSGHGGEWFGFRLALDGGTLVVGAPTDWRRPSVGSGWAYVFTHSGSAWSQAARLASADGADGDQFGFGVAVQGDVLVVGAPFDDTALGTPADADLPFYGRDAGSATVFLRAADSWQQAARLVPGGLFPGAYFGTDVEMLGTTLAVSAFFDDAFVLPGAAKAGAVTVFQGAAALWVPQARLTPEDGQPGDEYGYGIDVGPGEVAVGSLAHATSAGGSAGSVYVYPTVPPALPALP